MKVLACHNYYQQRGGEDCSFEQEAELLETNGHQVVRYTLHNDEINQLSKVALAAKTIWNRAAFNEVRDIIRRERPDVMHCTNLFPLVSPAIYYAASRENVPVVQALRNYRLLCPKAQFLRDGSVCEDCLNKTIPWPAVLHSCYRDNRTATLAVSMMLSTHNLAQTWHRKVTLFYTQSEFAQRKLIEGGLPADRLLVKPNFSRDDVRIGSGEGGYATFVGRLSPEKGIQTLLDAWKRLDANLQLKIVGDGPMAGMCAEAAASDPRIECLGSRNSNEVLEILADARCLVFPSIWYETFGRTIVESLSTGTPVVVSKMGAMAELVKEGHNGLLFTPGDPDDLASKLQLMVEMTDANCSVREAARQTFEAAYTPEINYQTLLSILQKAIAINTTAATTNIKYVGEGA